MSAPISPVGPGRALDNSRGLILMFLGFFVFAAVDTIAKFLTTELPTLQVVWTRQLGLLAVALYLLATRGAAVLRCHRPALQVLRGGLAAASAATFIFAMSFVPLADAVAVSFVAPFVVTVLGALILREPVGAHRWIAVTVGFLATLLVIRPGMGVVHPAMLLVVLAACFFAGRQVVSRVLAAHDETATTIAYTALVGSLLLTLPLPFVWRTPEALHTVVLMLAIAPLAGLGEYLMIKALEHAQAVVVAPMHYTLIVWSTMYGFLVFGQFPDRWTWLGTGLIIASGLYTIHRERLAQRRRLTATA